MVRSAREYYNMIIVYGQCGENAEEAAREYRVRFPGDVPACPKAFRALASRAHNTGSLVPIREGGMHPQRTSVAQEEAILEAFNQDPDLSIRSVSRRLNISKSTVHRILQNNGMHPFKLNEVHQLDSGDFKSRVQYCRWLLGNIEHNPLFCRYVLWTNEAVFTNEGIFSGHNSYVLNYENSLAICPRTAQARWSINVWAGICGECIIGPYILPDRLDGTKYLMFLKHVLPNLLEEIPLEIRKNMYYQHGGTSPHFTATVQSYLNETFHDRWIGHGGAVTWPPQSPDLDPLDFFFWTYMKTMVYQNPVDSPEEAVAKIHAALALMPPTTLQSIQDNIVQRARFCTNLKGRYVETTL